MCKPGKWLHRLLNRCLVVVVVVRIGARVYATVSKVEHAHDKGLLDLDGPRRRGECWIDLVVYLCDARDELALEIKIERNKQVLPHINRIVDVT